MLSWANRKRTLVALARNSASLAKRSTATSPLKGFSVPTSGKCWGLGRRHGSPEGWRHLNVMKTWLSALPSDLSGATGWQAHSVRGFLSGTVKKKMGLAVVSEKDGKGIRRYRIAMDVAA